MALLLSLMSGCSTPELRSDAIVPESLGRIDVDCAPSVPFDLCSEATRSLSGAMPDTTTAGHTAPDTKVLITGYTLHEKAVSVNRDASAEQYRISATANVRLIHKNALLFDKAITKKSTYHNDADNILGKNKERRKIVHYLNRLIAKDIPYLLSPYSQVRIHAEHPEEK